MFDSRVEVDPKVKDRWGIPVARLSGTRHPHTLEIASYIAEQGGGVAEGGGRHPDLEEDPGPGPERRPAPGGHLPHGQRSQDFGGGPLLPVHDIDNLYVIDGSVHVTNGGFNPVLTIMANRLPSRPTHRERSWKGTKVRS